MSKQSAAKPQAPLPSVAEAERVLADLQRQRAACVQRGVELADERANVALAAHTGEKPDCGVFFLPGPAFAPGEAYRWPPVRYFEGGPYLCYPLARLENVACFLV